MTREPPTGDPATPRVAIIYQVLHHFRDPVFSLLCGRGPSAPKYRLFASAKNDIDSNETLDPSRADRETEAGGLPWTFLRNRPLPGPFLWQSGVIRAALSRKNDVIIFLGNMYFLSTWVGAILARMRGKRILFWGHGYRSPERNLKGALRERFYRLGDGVLLYGDRAKAIFEQREFDGVGIYVVYNSLDYARQQAVRDRTTQAEVDELKRTLFRKPDAPMLVCIGRIQPRKRLEVLVEAIKVLGDRGKHVNLLLVGDGDAIPHLGRHAIANGVEDRVHFYGACYDEEKIGPLLLSSDLCVCPGSIGLTVVHAMAYGVPVLTHDNFDDHGPEAEAIVPGRTGDLYRFGDFDHLTERIENWLSAHPDREAVAKRCIEKIEDRYTPERQVIAIDAAVRGLPAVSASAPMAPTTSQTPPSTRPTQPSEASP